MIILVIILILAVLFPKGIKNLISLALISIFALFLWEIAWWGKVIDVLIMISIVSAFIYGIVQAIKEGKEEQSNKSPSKSLHKKQM
ncbi:hypothetical protein [Aneurinibacillus aneurinilyticus]|uniref:Uncharacterized protein n=1 Tax=Aneurinibacillus aneurinilyticus ATCC 12856 TaxID=649747 RepID=U1X791_ANEAE|nr:hypothetical protein [Aneurinibacillus aneurinilyticus]ERI10825.1 hypothetical protein HMPREF0083_01081 [Aneurinibacillus aneurinilyticus ATCC 12856]MED0705914.1 hypothetical protein [Aneurinibacillus aneurinilyticus]MED0722697.1 hypothetical protein [Aneurinibacillus aneurinilyticus]MED0731383.1 hypothetical protein [Aneurinibacillus aneurinilyticus]MED0740139.1 hypothetical protein [Aneurinibacillus aneurinilyticus]